jgi:hypothetical protein
MRAAHGPRHPGWKTGVTGSLMILAATGCSGAVSHRVADRTFVVPDFNDMKRRISLFALTGNSAGSFAFVLNPVEPLKRQIVVRVSAPADRCEKGLSQILQSGVRSLTGRYETLCVTIYYRTNRQLDPAHIYAQTVRVLAAWDRTDQP